MLHVHKILKDYYDSYFNLRLCSLGGILLKQILEFLEYINELKHTKGKTNLSPAIIHVKRTDEQRRTDGCPGLEATDKINRCNVGAQTAS